MSMQAGKQEPDALPAQPMFVTLVVLTAIVVATGIGVTHYAKSEASKMQPNSAARAAVPHVDFASNGEPLPHSPIPQFGMLHQTLFDTASDAKELRTAANARLGSDGWNDASKTTAHIRIDEAMKLVVQQHAQAK